MSGNMLIDEPRGYTVELARIRIFRPARCVWCGRFIGNSNLGGRNGKRQFICIACTEKEEAR